MGHRILSNRSAGKEKPMSRKITILGVLALAGAITLGCDHNKNNAPESAGDPTHASNDMGTAAGDSMSPNPSTTGGAAATANDRRLGNVSTGTDVEINNCLLYTSDAADDLLCVDLGGRRI